MNASISNIRSVPMAAGVAVLALAMGAYCGVPTLFEGEMGSFLVRASFSIAASAGLIEIAKRHFGTRAPPAPARAPAYMEYESELATALTQSPRPFTDYLEPNEWPVSRIRPHLEDVTEWIVSVGTWRSFFNLILAPEGCQGVVVRDINQNVKKYVDGLVLMLRIAKDTTEFRELFFKQIGVAKGRDLIASKIKKDFLMPKTMKKYYLKHLDQMCQVCFNAQFDPFHLKQFNEVDFTKHESMFVKLQKYAQAGRIIATVGGINDLKFLTGYGIQASVVDTSNIHLYSPLSIEIDGSPRIIWTWLPPLLYPDQNTQYYSSPFEEFTNERLQASLPDSSQ